MNRRTFLKWLGIGAATVAVNPMSLIEEPDIIDAQIVGRTDKLPGYESVHSDNGSMYTVNDDGKVMKSTDLGVTWWDETGAKVYRG